MEDLIYGKYKKVDQNHQDTYYFQNPNEEALKEFSLEKQFVETEVCLPLSENGLAMLLHKMPDLDARKNLKQDTASISMQWRANVGVTGGKYYYEIKIIEKPSIVMLGWSTMKTKIFQDTVFSFGTDPNAYMLDCSAGVLWHDGCTQSRVSSAAEVDDIYGSVLDYDEKVITFYHIRRGKRRVLDTARFDPENSSLKSVTSPLFPSVGLYCGQVAFYGKSRVHDGGLIPISEGFEDKITVSLVHSTNLPKAPSLDYYIVTLEWMQKIYVKFFDGTAIPYGADAYKHMTLPFFSIFQPQLFEDEHGNSGAPDPEMFNEHPEELWSLFFRAFLFAALFEGFDAYLKERDSIYQKKYLAQNPNTTFTSNVNQIRPRTTLEIRQDSAMKSALLFNQSMEFEDVRTNGLYNQNLSEIEGLFRKCEVRLDNVEHDPQGVEKALLELWNKIINHYNQNKDAPIPVEANLESKLQDSFSIITNAQAELQARVKGVWEAYVCYNLPNLAFPQTQTLLKEYVRLAKTSLQYYLDKEPSQFPGQNGENNVPVTTPLTSQTPFVATIEQVETPSILKEGNSKESDNTIFLGLAIGALIVGGGFYFFMKKKEEA